MPRTNAESLHPNTRRIERAGMVQQRRIMSSEFTAEEIRLRETSWDAGSRYVSLKKEYKMIGYECCQVLAIALITDRCWNCGGAGKYFERISYRAPIKKTNPYAGHVHGPGKLSHLSHP